MAVQPFKGTLRQYLVELDAVPTILAESGRWQLRVYPRFPSLFYIAAKTALVGSAATITPDDRRPGRWEVEVEGTLRSVDSPEAAFHLWTVHPTEI